MTRSSLYLTALIAGSILSGGALSLSPAHADYAYSYYGYDHDNDGYLEENEYVDYSYGLIDYNEDGYIDEDEWDSYIDVWYDPYDLSYDATYDFDYYDTDNDGFIELTEYEAAYDEVLRDGGAVEIELADAVFAVEPRADILHRVVRWQLARRQAGLQRGYLQRMGS